MATACCFCCCFVVVVVCLFCKRVIVLNAINKQTKKLNKNEIVNIEVLCCNCFFVVVFCVCDILIAII